jgi:DNA-binding CsgD family transcriptional regulator
MIVVSPERLSGVIADIYDAALAPDHWSRVVSSLAAIFDSQQVAFNVLDGDARAVQFIAAHGLGAKDFELFRAFAATTDVPQWWQTAPADRPSLRSAISPDHEFSRTSYYNEVIRPSGSFYAVLAPVMRVAEVHADLIVARETTSKDYGAGHLAVMQMLMPHLRRAVELGRKLATGRSLLSTFSHLPFGVMFVDPHLRVVDMNEAAEAIVMRSRSPLRVKSGALSIKDPQDHAALQRLATDACRMRGDVIPGIGGDLLIKRRDVGVEIALSVGPLVNTLEEIPFLGRHAVIFIRELSLDLPAGFAEQVRALFGLTPKEADLSASLTAGRTLKQAAHDNQIQFSTARTHLEKIFRKTETRQQSQLVALLKSAHSITRKIDR